MNILRITNGRVIDPSQSLDQVGDLWIGGSTILGIGPQPDQRASQTLDATGKIVCPGLIDMHVHLRQPGNEEDETIASGAQAAVAGGFTTIACMPNTQPPLDSQAAVEFVVRLAERAGKASVLPVGALTKGRKGQELTEMGALVDGGAVAFSDDDAPIASAEIMRRALEYCRMFDRAVLSHSEDLDLSRGGLMHEGHESMLLGLRGIPTAAEEIMVYRDLALAELTGGRLHILHVATAQSVELIRVAKKRGVRVTAEACPHHFTLTEKALRNFDSNFKVYPPLRTENDVQAIIGGLKDGTIDVIASDHSPHASEKKMRELDQAPFGMTGLETLLPICITHLIEPGHLSWPQLIGKLTFNPAEVLRVPKGSLRPGADADVTIIDPAAPWQIDAGRFHSRSKNTPFDGAPVRGKAVTVIVGGVVKYTV
jgi:dihydroorotase